ncbi:MAG: hypothetical protein WBG92_05290 [Thiohalocapsa sp.]
MFGKFFVTAAVIYVAYLVVRSRYQGSESSETNAATAKGDKPLLAPDVIKFIAYALAGLMVVGTALYLFQSWERHHQVVHVQVINPFSGQVQNYETRRGDIGGRSFRTLDGRLIRIAEMERLVIDDSR